MKKLFSIVCLIHLLMFCSLTPSYATQPISYSQQNYMRNQMFKMINNERRKDVRLYSPLLKSANLRAKEASQKWSHTRPNQTR